MGFTADFSSLRARDLFDANKRSSEPWNKRLNQLFPFDIIVKSKGRGPKRYRGELRFALRARNMDLDIAISGTWIAQQRVQVHRIMRERGLAMRLLLRMVWNVSRVLK
jgi:hypothetical protein